MRDFKFLFQGVAVFIGMVSLLTVMPHTAFAVSYDWTERSASGSRAWTAVASSANGQKLSAVVNGGYIYTSTDGGATWTEQTAAGSRAWLSIASSDDGAKLIAADSAGYLYTSTDSGANWTERTTAGERAWFSVTSSEDGMNLAAVADYNLSTFNPDSILTSTNGGATWTEQTNATEQYWVSIAGSADGSVLIAGGDTTNLFLSTDSGANWTELSDVGDPGIGFWSGLAVSDDGEVILATNRDGNNIFSSIDGGVTWTEETTAGARTWQHAAMSGDGTKWFAASEFDSVEFDEDYIYISDDEGDTWTAQTDTGRAAWTIVAVSSDGLLAVAGADGQNLFTGQVPDTTPPNISSISTDGLSQTEATITWTTDEAATSRVMYGETSSYGASTTLDTTPVTSHSVDLSGLEEDTTYHFAVVSTDAAGNTSTSTDQTFTTLENSRESRNEPSRVIGGSVRNPVLNTYDAELAKLIAQITQLQNIFAQYQNSPQSSVSMIFKRDLTIGSIGEDVRALQNFLIEKFYLQPGKNTGYFGPLTQAALATYQHSKGITPSVGYFGPKTRASIIGQ